MILSAMICFPLSAKSCFTVPGICLRFTISAQRLTRALFCHDDLPDLSMPGAEYPRARKQIKFPHSLKNFVISPGQAGPGFLKPLVPGHKGFSVVRPKIMNVLHDKKAFSGLADLGDTGQHPIGENICLLYTSPSPRDRTR